MDIVDHVGDIAAASRSCVAAFEGLQPYRAKGNTSHDESISGFLAGTETLKNTDPNKDVLGTRLEDIAVRSRVSETPLETDEAFWNDIDTSFARFRVWAANLGALQRGSSSLDVRLRDLDIMRMAILRILKGLNGTLVQCTQIASCERLPFDKQIFSADGNTSCSDTDSSESVEDVDDDDEEFTELAMHTHALHTFLADLYRLSFKVRNTKICGRAPKATAFKRIDRDTGVDVFSVYEYLDRQHVFEHLLSIRGERQELNSVAHSQNDFDDPADQIRQELDDNGGNVLVQHPVYTYPGVEKDPLAHRLALANTYRRRCFGYWRNHALKLAVEEEAPTIPKVQIVNDVQLKPQGSLPTMEVLRSLPTPNPIAATILSGTDATALHPTIQETLDTDTVVSYATTAYGLEGESVKLPPPPVQATMQFEFSCPLCHVMCPSRQGKGKAWRLHVLQDLQPYVCTYNDCYSSDTVYNSRNSWLEHERLHHRRVWQCHEHTSETFKSQEDFETHLGRDHDKMSEVHIQQVASFAEVTVADDRAACPFCLKNDIARDRLYHHMAYHQEHIATFALSRQICGQGDDCSTSSNAQGEPSKTSLDAARLGSNGNATLSSLGTFSSALHSPLDFAASSNEGEDNISPLDATSPPAPRKLTSSGQQREKPGSRLEARSYGEQDDTGTEQMAATITLDAILAMSDTSDGSNGQNKTMKISEWAMENTQDLSDEFGLGSLEASSHVVDTRYARLGPGSTLMETNDAKTESTLVFREPSPVPLEPEWTGRPNGGSDSSAQMILDNLFRWVDDNIRTANPEDFFKRISKLLRGFGNETWSMVPRLYTVLRLIGELDNLDLLIQRGLSDLWFPFTHNVLPAELSPTARTKFLDQQHIVMFKNPSIQSSTRYQHVHYAQGEPIPYTTVAKLGVGAHGYVDKVESAIDSREYARKLYRRHRLRDRGGDTSFFVELQVLKRVRHIHCVDLVQSYTDPKYFALIMLPLAECNLSEYFDIARESQHRLSALRSFFGCLANALQYCHSIQIRHRNIKPQKILVKGDHVYLSGFCIALDWQSLSRESTSDDEEKTWLYAAPEVAHYEKRNSAADVWSLGCVFMEMVTVLKGHTVAAMHSFFEARSGSYRFYGNTEHLGLWVKELRGTGKEKDNAMFGWIREMLGKSAEDRPTALALYDHIVNESKESHVPFCGSCCVDNLKASSVEGSDEDDLWE